MNKKEIGEMIRRERMKRGLNQKKFSSEIQESCGLVCDWEKGRKQPTGTKLIKLIQYFGNDFIKKIQKEESNEPN